MQCVLPETGSALSASLGRHPTLQTASGADDDLIGPQSNDPPRSLHSPVCELVCPLRECHALPAVLLRQPSLMARIAYPGRLVGQEGSQQVTITVLLRLLLATGQLQ